jgi:hypothetical protein
MENDVAIPDERPSDMMARNINALAEAAVRRAQKYNDVIKLPGVRRTVDALVAKVGNDCWDTIFAMETKRELIWKIVQHPGVVAHVPEKAMAAMGENKLLVYIPSVFLYVVFTVEEYHAFVGQVTSSIEYDAEGSVPHFAPRQLLLSMFPQKVIFLCDDEESTVTKMLKYCKDYFKCNVSTTKQDNKVEFIIDKIAANLDAVHPEFAKFASYVCNQDEKLANSFQSLKPRTLGTHTYLDTQMVNQCDAKSIFDILSLINGGPLTVNFTINNHCGIINGNVNGNHNNIGSAIALGGVDDNEQFTRAWIASNPPQNRESRKVYYNRYTKIVQNPVTNSMFSRLVSENPKYGTVSVHGKRHWIIL